MAALDCGLPLVLLPLGADQPYNARRCAALGVGRILAPGERTPGAIRAAVQAMLADPSYRRQAADMCAELRSLPGPEFAVALLARLAAEGAPQVTSPPDAATTPVIPEPD